MNFFYVVPQKPGMPIKLVVPTLLQMGWIESPPYFLQCQKRDNICGGTIHQNPSGIIGRT